VDPSAAPATASPAAVEPKVTAQKVANLFGMVIPFLGIILAVVLLWDRFVGPMELSLLAGGYVVTVIGVTVGFHRLLTHRAFRTYPAVRYTLAVMGSMAVEGSVIKWVADHRKHHTFADDDGDPHSPHGGGPGIAGALRGLWHAHMGWLFTTVGRADRARYAKDLVSDRGMRLIDRAELPLLAATLAIPFGLGYALTGTLRGALLGLLWGGLVRIFLLHHVTFSINSICHFFGRRRFATDDRSGNVFWLSVASFGESWHHNHHAFPTSAFHGLRRREVDLGGLFIRALERVGLAWDVVRISPERQLAKQDG
jgi:stearoyl-CoA desaturase (delta-9 desaturase)